MTAERFRNDYNATEVAARLDAALEEHKMRIDDLRTFATSRESHIRQIALTREAAAALVAEHDREVNRAASDAGDLFEIPERDDGAFAARNFAKFASAEADYQRALAEVRGV